MDVCDLGMMPYDEAMEVQKNRAREVKGGGRETLILCEHPHVFTIGRHGDTRNLLSRDVPLVRTDRGGDITYHGPGQLVCYPIVDVARRNMGTRAYVSFLEETIIELLGNCGIAGERFGPYRGVWVEKRKIAAIGVRISEGIATHGSALNVNTDLSYFEKIIPCGIALPATSLEKEKDTRQDLERIKREYAELFCSRWLSP